MTNTTNCLHTIIALDTTTFATTCSCHEVFADVDAYEAHALSEPTSKKNLVRADRARKAAR